MAWAAGIWRTHVRTTIIRHAAGRVVRPTHLSRIGRHGRWLSAQPARRRPPVATRRVRRGPAPPIRGRSAWLPPLLRRSRPCGGDVLDRSVIPEPIGEVTARQVEPVLKESVRASTFKTRASLTRDAYPSALP